MVETLSVAPKTRQIRVFLSSTFRDFMEERDLLVKQVFPALRRRAQERGVEVVDVDLRWGITEEESQQGKVIGICLAEIERCRPYFIGMLGERYGWTPQPGDYPDELFEREPLQWIRDHQGNASVTELEILHGVLNNKEMAGRAFFYFRDPAWSQAQNEPGFVCDTEEEKQKLAHLKEHIRSSGFPVADNLADPQAIADRIEADLWALIEELYPELDQADALEREARKHAGYRQSRLGVYLGGEGYIQQLEQWIQAGEPKILITGDSGAGKSALIANWLAAHGQAHPDDAVHAHHLGCSNDANAIRPLLARLLDTASRLLLEHELIFEPIKVPQDWWELTDKVAGTLQDLGRWCRTTGHRWIWVLDGLDRLDADDQQALPWLPLLIPEGVNVVISALECPARTILEERQFRTLTIGPLQRPEQEALIERYLERYTKKLEPERRQQILNCKLARSPLFLKVLLEELRQCGRYETLKDQIVGYIRPKADGSLEVSDLYERVLERLENDCGVEVVSKVMTALWASRAGLSESELLAITGLAPLQWASIDLALEQALGRNGYQLVFDHEYLRRSVQKKYLISEESRRRSHNMIADYFDCREEWDARDSHELPYQFTQANRNEDLKDLLLEPPILARLVNDLGTYEILRYWAACFVDEGLQMSSIIEGDVRKFVFGESYPTWARSSVAYTLANLLAENGVRDRLLLDLRTFCFQLEEEKADRDLMAHSKALGLLAKATLDTGDLDEAELLYKQLFEGRAGYYGTGHPETIISLRGLACLYKSQGDLDNALVWAQKAEQTSRQYLGEMHIETAICIGDLATLLFDIGEDDKALVLQTEAVQIKASLLGTQCIEYITSLENLACMHADRGDFKRAEEMHLQCLTFKRQLLGPESPQCLQILNNLSILYHKSGYHGKALAMYKECLDIYDRRQEHDHPEALIAYENLAMLHQDMGDYEQAETCFRHCLLGRERRLGCDHSDTNITRLWLANLLSEQERFDESIPLRRHELSVASHKDGRDALEILTSIHQLAKDLFCISEFQESEQLYREALDGRRTALGDDDVATMSSRYGLAACLTAQGRTAEAIPLMQKLLSWHREKHGDTDKMTLTIINDLAIYLRENGNSEESEILFRELIPARQMVLQPGDFDIGCSLGGLAKTLEESGKLEEALNYAQQALDHRLMHEGPDTWWTNRNRLDLARILQKLERFDQAISLLDELQISMTSFKDPDADDQALLSRAAELCASILSNRDT